MAGALSSADDRALVVAAPASVWTSARAHAALVQVLRLLPTDARACAACVCRAWRDVAADAALWHTLWFDDDDSASSDWLSNATLERLCARAGAALRELRLDSTYEIQVADLFTALRAGGCADVRRLTACFDFNVEQAQQLAALCPVLEHLDCWVRCDNPHPSRRGNCVRRAALSGDAFGRL